MNYASNEASQPMQSIQGAMRNALSIPTVRENLEIQLRDAESNVARIKEALAILSENPNIERLLTLLGRY